VKIKIEWRWAETPNTMALIQREMLPGHATPLNERRAIMLQSYAGGVCLALVEGWFLPDASLFDSAGWDMVGGVFFMRNFPDMTSVEEMRARVVEFVTRAHVEASARIPGALGVI